MGVLNISDLEPGMALENDVVTTKGTKLLLKGVELTARHIEILRTWGIDEASIEGVSKEDITMERMSRISEEEQGKIRAEVDTLFAGFEDEEVMCEIRRIVTKIKINRLTQSP